MRFDPIYDGDFKEAVRSSLPKHHFIREYITGAHVLDVGCWIGGFEYHLVGSAASVTGIDIEPRALDVAAKNLPQARFIEASVLDMPFEPETFDVVTCWDVIEHLPPKTERIAMSEMARVLKKGGIFSLSTPSGKTLSKILDPAYFLTGHRHYSHNEIVNLVWQSGLKVKEIKILGGWYVVADYMLMYLYKYLLRSNKPLWKAFSHRVFEDAQREGFVTLFLVAEKQGNANW